MVTLILSNLTYPGDKSAYDTKEFPNIKNK